MRFHQAFTIAAFCSASILFLCGCGSEQEGDSAPTASLSGSQTVSNGGPDTSAPEADPLRPVVVVSTSLGKFEIELDASAAAGTVSNFLNYVNDRHYDGTTFHYANSESLVLGGMFTPDGKEKPTHPPIRSEAFNGLKNVRGSVAINRDPEQIDSATCDFFVNVRDNPKFDYDAQKNPDSEKGSAIPNVSAEDFGYCVFGRVTSGIEVVDKIAAQGTGTEGAQNSPAVKPVVINSIRLAGQSAQKMNFGGVEVQR